MPNNHPWTALGVPIDSVAAPAGGPLFGTELGPQAMRDHGLVRRLDAATQVTWPSGSSAPIAIRAAASSAGQVSARLWADPDGCRGNDGCRSAAAPARRVLHDPDGCRRSGP